MTTAIEPPDYRRSLVSLMAALGHGLGEREVAYEPLPDLPPALLHGRVVVLLVVDGLGERLLAHLPPEAPLRRHRKSGLQSVFPSTTASAITTFATGAAPARHAITGWFTWLKELGSVATVLPFRPRHGGPAYTGISPRELVGAGPLSERIAVTSAFFHPREIAHSIYSRFASGPAKQSGYSGLAGLFGGLAGEVGAGAPRYLFGYWSELDSLAHRFGSESAQVLAHLREIDRAFGTFIEAIAGSGALVLLTADHGLIDSAPERVIRLEAHPRLAETLALPLCGEPRAAFCYVRPARQKSFIDYVNGELSERCDLIPAERLLEERWFGPGPVDPRLFDRIGDYLLLPRERHVIHDRIPSEGPFDQRGVHGGLTPEEREVPLVVVEC